MPARRLITAFGFAVIAALWVCGCDSSRSSADARAAYEARMREIERRVKDSLPKTEAIALAQPADAAVVRKAQAELRVLQEYLDEPSGKLDSVTVNAIEAFQRRAGLRDDGLLDARTLRALESRAAKAGATSAP